MADEEIFPIKTEVMLYPILKAAALGWIVVLAIKSFSWSSIKAGWLSFPIVVAIAGCLTVYYRKAYATKMSRHTLSGVTVLGMRKVLHLEDIIKIKERSFFGARYLTVFSGKVKSPIWIPALHENQIEFEKSVIANCALGNPLRRYFEK